MISIEPTTPFIVWSVLMVTFGVTITFALAFWMDRK